MPTIESLILTNDHEQATQTLEASADEWLAARIRPAMLPWCTLDAGAWDANDPQHDLVIAEIRRTLATDLDVVYHGVFDHRYIDPEFVLRWNTIPTNLGSVTQVICIYDDEDLDSYDDDDYNALTVGHPVARLSSVHPVCGESLVRSDSIRPRQRRPYSINGSYTIPASEFTITVPRGTLSLSDDIQVF